MKIKMYVYGGYYLIPTNFDPRCNSLNTCVFIQCGLNQQIEICKSHSIRRRWNKIDIETPNSFEVAKKEYFSIIDLYSPGVLDTHLNYIQPGWRTKIKLVSDWRQNRCFISSIEEGKIAI